MIERFGHHIWAPVMGFGLGQERSTELYALSFKLLSGIRCT